MRRLPVRQWLSTAARQIAGSHREEAAKSCSTTTLRVRQKILPRGRRHSYRAAMRRDRRAHAKTRRGGRVRRWNSRKNLRYRARRIGLNGHADRAPRRGREAAPNIPAGLESDARWAEYVPGGRNNSTGDSQNRPSTHRQQTPSVKVSSQQNSRKAQLQTPCG